MSVINPNEIFLIRPARSFFPQLMLLLLVDKAFGRFFRMIHPSCRCSSLCSYRVSTISLKVILAIHTLSPSLSPFRHIATSIVAVTPTAFKNCNFGNDFAMDVVVHL